ncbi:MAG: hypothetical protein II951_10445 [Bacteroidales bacterium]|nr:hypothetical protein [Bacteroidales bacterium]
MIQYLFAKDDNDNLVCINDVRKEQTKPHHYCIECGAEMTAVQGTQKQWHFRHKGAHCSRESYLHKLGKMVVVKRFKECDKLVIRYKATRTCEHSEECLFRRKLNCCPETPVDVDYDLKQYYTSCQEEGCFGKNNWRADVLLSNESYKLAIEIDFTNKCTKEKVDSGFKIIEIAVNSEYDLVNLYKRSIWEKGKGMTFYNFKEKCKQEPQQLIKLTFNQSEDGYIIWEFTHVKCNSFEQNKNCLLEIVALIENAEDRLRSELLRYAWSIGIRRGVLPNNCKLCSNRCRYVVKLNGIEYEPRSLNCRSCIEIGKQCKGFWLNTREYFEIERKPHWIYVNSRED